MVSAVILSMYSGLIASSAIAQQEAPQIEEVMVIGSQIRGARITDSLPVSVVGQEEIAAGVNNEGLPISIEFLGRPFSEEVLFRLGYAYEQATNHRIVPTLTPALQGEHIQIP